MSDTSATGSLTLVMPRGVTVIPFAAGASLHDVLLAAGMPLRSGCGGQGLCGLCLVRIEGDGGGPPTPGEAAHLSAAQLQQGLRLACQLAARHGMRVRLETPQMQDAWRALREDEYGPALHVPPAAGARLGAAIDLGTTHIRATLWDRHLGRRLGGLSGLNPQRDFGADVLTRLMQAQRSPEFARHITAAARQAIASALRELARSASIAPHEIGELRVVGNTAMLSLLAGRNHGLLLLPEYWTQGIDCTPQDADALRAEWALSPDAALRFTPPLGGFIGSDLLAGILAARLVAHPPGALLVDFGTNTEMALWDGETLHVAAAAGGPAFEGVGIRHGMPGEAGAIFRVRAADAGAFAIEVLGGGPPLGICGSGLVDAIACLLRDGRLDRVGRLAAADDGLVLHAAERSIVLTRRDVDAFQRAKAAIGAGVRWLCERAGMRLADLRHVHACGAFGRLLDAGNARAIGLLPPQAAVELQGNSALAGCELLLADVEAQDVLRGLQVHNLAMEEKFEDMFVDSLYLEPMRD